MGLIGRGVADAKNKTGNRASATIRIKQWELTVEEKESEDAHRLHFGLVSVEGVLVVAGI